MKGNLLGTFSIANQVAEHLDSRCYTSAQSWRAGPDAGLASALRWIGTASATAASSSSQ
jgi:hypothetical protein